jgi:hypothetical protein
MTRLVRVAVLRGRVSGRHLLTPCGAITEPARDRRRPGTHPPVVAIVSKETRGHDDEIEKIATLNVRLVNE